MLLYVFLGYIIIILMVDKSIEYVSIQKDTLNCIICLDICRKAVLSNCCECQFCLECSEGIKKSKEKVCPNCRQYDIQFEESMALQKIINTIMTKCPIDSCEREMQREFIVAHLKNDHKDDEQLSTLLSKLEIKDEEILDDWGVFDIHCHQMSLVSAQSDTKCCSSKYLKATGNCMRNLPAGTKFYYCKDCKEPICVKCRDKKQVKFYVKYHSHPLELTFKDQGWTCDGKHLSDGCRSDSSTFFSSDKKMRYRCGRCDYDMCGNCLEYYAFN
jgi:hypothetical protein